MMQRWLAGTVLVFAATVAAAAASPGAVAVRHAYRKLRGDRGGLEGDDHRRGVRPAPGFRRGRLRPADHRGPALGSLRLPPELTRGLRSESRNREVASWQSDAGLRLEVHADSVLRIVAPRAMAVRIEGAFRPEYLKDQPGVVMALDERAASARTSWTRPR